VKKVLVVGIGEHAKRRILPALSSVNGIENIFITSRTEVKNLNSDHVFLSKKEILNSNYLFDSIIISSVPSVHIENLQEFRNKSKYFLIEKPLTSKLDYVNSNEFLDLNKNIDIKECLMYIHHPIYNEFKKIIRNNKLEKVLASFKIPHLDKNNFRYSKQSGASSILDQGIYPISLILENFTIDENSMINSISFDRDLNIDTGGNLKCKSSDGIDIEINWEGSGLNEKGLCSKSGKEMVVINPRYYRPAEVELLHGDSTYAQKKLGWKPKTSLDELVKIMMDYDLKFDGYGFD